MISLILFSALKTIVAWFVVSYIGTNLVGFVGRGFLEMSLDPNDHPDLLKGKSNVIVTGLSILVTVGVFFYLYNWWGLLFLIALILAMISRIPDLYWEVRILPGQIGVSYPVPKDLIQEAMKTKNKNISILETLLEFSVPIVLFIAFFIQR